MAIWVCNQNSDHVFTDTTDDGCCDKCDGVLVKKEGLASLPSDPDPDIYDGAHGLGIFVFDLSPSMEEYLDLKGNSPLTKIRAVARAFSSTIKTLLHGGGNNITPISQPANFYLAIIGFSEIGELFTITKLEDMKQGDSEATFHYWENWILEKFEDFGNMTNITAGLEKALTIYDIALANKEDRLNLIENLPDDIKAYDHVLQEIELNSQVITSGENTYKIPNVRVLVYSDGHQTTGEFKNPFKNRFLKTGLQSAEGTPTNGVMSIYFGAAEDPGAKQMSEIAGYCPVHGGVGYIPISKVQHDKYLRNLLHLTSNATGFCLLCANQ